MAEALVGLIFACKWPAVIEIDLLLVLKCFEGPLASALWEASADGVQAVFAYGTLRQKLSFESQIATLTDFGVVARQHLCPS